MHGRPFADQALDRLAREAIGARHLLPHGEADAIGPVEIARVLDLLMLADAVEAHLPWPARRRACNAASSGAVRPLFRPVALIEHHAQQIRPAVEQEAVALHGGTERSAVYDSHLVDELAAFAPELELHVDQVRRVRTPEQLVARIVDARIRQGDAAMDFARDDLIGVGGEQRAAAA